MRNRCDMFLKNNASVSWKLKTSGSPSEILELLITSTSTQKKSSCKHSALILLSKYINCKFGKCLLEQ